MIIMDEISSIKNFFDSYHIKLSPVWLESCINWCKEENLPSNYTLKDLQLKVYEQWLLLDLQDVEIPSLPPDLSNKVLYTLNGSYALQMMKLVDISKPKFWQLQRIRNNVKNVDEQTESSKRVLQLTLTDGVQEVEAMEYKPIQALNLNLTPGIKIMISGPVTIRRGRLMLQNQNVKILGGEVDDLIVPNAAENVLARILKLPLNENPHVIEESLLSANKDMFNETDVASRPVPQNQTMVRNNSTVQPPAVNVNNQRSYGRELNASVRKPTKEHSIADLTEEEEMRIAAEIDMLMEVENEVQNSKKTAPSKTPDMFDDMDFNDCDFENINIPETTIKTNKESSSKSTMPPVNQNKAPVYHIEDSVDLTKSLEQENDIFENLDIDAHLGTSNKGSEIKPPTPQKPVLTIEKLLKNIPNISNGKFKIKAKFKSVVEKLSVKENEFYLVVQVEDESGDITVRFHSDVVSDMAGCSLETLLSLKTGILEKNAEAQRKMLEIVKRIKEKLVHLNSIIEVQVNSREEYPVVINIQ